MYKFLIKAGLLLFSIYLSSCASSVESGESGLSTDGFAGSHVKVMDGITAFYPGGDSYPFLPSTDFWYTKIFTDQDRLAIFGRGGRLYLSEDSGESWQIFYLSRLAPKNGFYLLENLNTVYMHEDTILVYNKEAGQLCLSRDWGKSWTFIVDNPIVSGEHTYIMAPELREKELYVFRIEDDIVYASQEYKGYYRVFTFPIEGFTDSTLISRKLVNSETLPRIPFRDGYVGYKEDRGIFFCDRDFNNIEEAKGNDELPSLVFNSLAVKGDDLWVGTSRGLAVSRDGGEHFQIVDTGIDERFNTVAVRIGATGQIEIIQEENPNREKTTFTTGFPNNQNPESSLIVMFGVSYDDGATWSSWSYAGEEPIWRFVRSRSIGNGLRMHSDPERFFPNYNRMEMKPVDRRLTPNSTDLVTLTVTSEEIPSSGAIQWDYLSWDPKVGREYGFPVQRPFIFAREGHLVIGSENDGMAISDDEGQSWRQIRFDGLLKKRLYYSYYAREYTIDFDGSKFLICNGDSLLLSEDAGKSWREIDIGYPLEGEFQSCRILETKMIAHDWKSQYVSEDGGKSWTRTPDEDFFLYDPSFVNNYIPHYRFSDNTDDAILYKFNKRIPPLKKEPVLPDGYKLKEIWEYESTMYALAYMNSESGEKTCILRSEDEGTNWDLFWKKNGHAKIMRLIVQGDEIYLIHGTLVYLLDRNSGRFLGTLGIMDEYVRLGMGSIVPEPDGLFFPYSGVVYRIEKRPENGETIELQISN